MKSEARGLRSNYSNACARYTIYWLWPRPFNCASFWHSLPWHL